MIYAPRHFLRTVCGGLMLTSLGGCMMSHVHELPPPNYTIEGVWELNPVLSSDPDKVLAAVQPKPRTGPGSGRGPGQEGPAPEVINDPTTDLPPIDTTPGHEGQAIYRSNAVNDRYAYRPPLDFQNNALLGGQWLKIHQTDAEVSISNAATNRSFTPGERSVVSVPSGVADQVAGWSGRDFLIEVRPQIGPQVQETYTLSPDGKQLLVKITVASEGRNRAMKLTRVYDRSTKDPAQLRQTLQQMLPPADD
jgi:hypothetical protein